MASLARLAVHRFPRRVLGGGAINGSCGLLNHETFSALTPPPPLDVSRHALFLDLDGTLVDFAAHPEHVVASDALRLLLRQLAQSMGGAVAIVTGRTVASADAVLDGALVHIAGVHGAERRSGIAIEQSFEDVSRVAAAVADAQALAANGTLNADIEEKGSALVLHYRRTPQFADAVRGVAGELAHRHGLSILEGKMVVELKMGQRTKADAVADFMSDPVFSGRVPIAVGDDITDEDAFRAVNSRGGGAILVGEARNTAARWRLPDIDAVYAWLEAGVKP